MIEAGENWKARPDGTLEAEVELKPGESKDLKIALKWVNRESNLGSKANIAQIEKTEAEINWEDTNAEDDISRAEIIISIKTGEKISVIIIAIIIISLLAIVYIIIILINKKEEGPNINKIRYLRK